MHAHVSCGALLCQLMLAVPPQECMLAPLWCCCCRLSHALRSPKAVGRGAASPAMAFNGQTFSDLVRAFSASGMLTDELLQACMDVAALKLMHASGAFATSFFKAQASHRPGWVTQQQQLTLLINQTDTQQTQPTPCKP